MVVLQRADTKCQQCRATGFDIELSMAFQPIVDAERRVVVAQEALVRGARGEGAGSVFAHVNDDNRYRFDQECRVKAVQLAAKVGVTSLLHINFMPNAVYEPRACIQKSLEAARRERFPAANLMFEFTENERMSDPKHVENIVSAYKALGFWTALDDFGAGYAGLSLLARLQPNLIKIDMELLRDIHLSQARQVIVSALATMARELDITLLAEGVESEAELTALRAAGIRLFQGYHFAKPGFMSLPAVQGLRPSGLSRAG